MLLVFIAAFAGIGSYVLLNARAQSVSYGPAGTYSDWFFPDSGYKSLEWTFVPLKDPPESMGVQTGQQPWGALHYYAYNFGLVNSTGSVGRGYAGFQTNGLFKEVSQGKAINYSIWGSNGGKSPDGMVETNNTESSGFQIMMKYQWILNHKYYFELKKGPSGSDSSGTWWGLWVTDQNTRVKTFVGEQRVPSTIEGKSSITWNGHTSMFGEDTHWWYSINGHIYYECNDFPTSSMAAINITANQTVKPNNLTTSTTSGHVSTNNGHESTACNVSVYADKNRNVQHNLGTWSSTPSNNIATLLTDPAIKPIPTSPAQNEENQKEVVPTNIIPSSSDVIPINKITSKPAAGGAVIVERSSKFREPIIGITIFGVVLIASVAYLYLRKKGILLPAASKFYTKADSQEVTGINPDIPLPGHEIKPDNKE